MNTSGFEMIDFKILAERKSRPFSLPPVGEGLNEAKIVNVLVNPGDFVKEDHDVVSLETSKSAIEIPMSYNCRIDSVEIQEGIKVSPGDVLFMVTPTHENDVMVARKQAMSAVRTGLKYIATKNTNSLCTHEELGEYNFREIIDYISEIIMIASCFRKLPFGKLRPSLLPKLTPVLCDIAYFIADLEGYAKIARIAPHATECQRIIDSLKHHQENVITEFFDLLVESQIQAGLTKRRPKIPLELSRLREKHSRFFFLSVSECDLKIARQFERRLSNIGIHSFIYDNIESIGFGDNIDGRIFEALDRATHIIVFVSPGFQQSDWVPFEVGFAVAKKKRIIPYLVHAKTKIPDYLKDLRCLKSRKDVNDFLIELEL